MEGSWTDRFRQGVHDVLTKDGYKVTVVQNPTASLADDVAVTRRAIAAQDGPAVLVGHSYGGAVITEAGNDPKVKALGSRPPGWKAVDKYVAEKGYVIPLVQYSQPIVYKASLKVTPNATGALQPTLVSKA